jgi:predicted NUDIX family NTP pyrophosphohydrolase
MSPQRSAGILLYRRTPALEVWIAHMGGPFWAGRDAAAWSIPKGLHEPDEDELATALREFAEEIGTAAPAVDYERLGEFRYSSGKRLAVFAAETDFEIDVLAGNTFPLEWPPRSGRMQDFPEVDDAGWFSVETARQKLVKGQLPILDAIERRAGG